MILANHGIVSSSGGVPQIVTNGLILNLDAGNTLSYSGSGTTWSDLSGGGNDGTLINGAGYTSNYSGGITFDGVNDYVGLGQTLKLNDSDITYDLWFKVNSNIDVYNSVFAQADVNLSNYIVLGKNRSGSNDGKFYVGFQGHSVIDTLPGADLASLSIVNYQVVIKKISSVYNIKIYRNGTLTAQGNTSISSYNMNTWSNYNVRIGSTTSFYPELFLGNIHTVRMYNIALTDTDVLQNFNALKTRYGL
jgi:hypothetical protein